MDEHCRQGEGKSIYDVARIEAEWLVAFHRFVPAQQALDAESDEAVLVAAREFIAANSHCPLNPYQLAARLETMSLTQGAPKLSIKLENRIAEYYQD